MGSQRVRPNWVTKQPQPFSSGTIILLDFSVLDIIHWLPNTGKFASFIHHLITVSLFFFSYSFTYFLLLFPHIFIKQFCLVQYPGLDYYFFMYVLTLVDPYNTMWSSSLSCKIFTHEVDFLLFVFLGFFFANFLCGYVCICVCSVTQSASQTPLSMEFSRQEYWSGLLCPPPGDLPDSGIKPMSLFCLLHWQMDYKFNSGLLPVV